MNGILCLDKPADMTSFSCCAVARRLLGVKKVGHAGTLDPMATGVLPLLVGNASKALDWLPDHDKSYTATLRFGFTSDTLDVWGQVTPTGKPLPTLAAVEAALAHFRGNILQVPPMTSALKIDGTRLYELARQGKTVERIARPVTVYQLDILDFDPVAGELTLHCACSKGTYIRSICDDLGRELGCGAIMTALRRTKAAGFSLNDCVTLDEARALAQEGTLGARLLPVETVLATYPAVTVTAPQAVRFRNGGALALDRLRTPVTQTVRVFAPDGTFLGLGVPADGELTIGKLFV
ncbi:MAG: tRNA pseudouridine(55) synthase TruB [Clostridia bacterium]|nr:tRNA pseudouridine(55) synthase TruB [Clostridia bacterium]